MTDKALTKLGPQPVMRAPHPGELMESMIKQGVTSENVAAFKELVLMAEHMEDRNAKKEFAQAFIALQQEIPRVKATRTIPDKHGNVRSQFAPFEEIDKQAREICLKHGFTYAFAEGAPQQGKITKVCNLMHVGGHSVSNQYSVRIGQGPPGCSESQADGSAHSYAKRGALCDALNIVIIGMDNDARLEGAPVSPEQAEELERRVAILGDRIDKAAFFKFAGAQKFSEIAASRYDELDRMLSKKENR